MDNLAHIESDIEDCPFDDLKLDSSKSIDGWSVVEEGLWTQGSVYLHVEVDLNPNRLLLDRALVVCCSPMLDPIGS